MLLLSFAVGWFVMPVQAITMTIVSEATTDETRGRVAGALNASMAVAGVMADVVGMRVVFFAGGAVAMAAAAVAWVLFRTGDETDRAASMPARPVRTAWELESKDAGRQPARQLPTVVDSQPMTDR